MFLIPGLLQAGPPMAQAAAAMEEIVVTATKRASSLQDVSIAVAVVDGQRIDEQGISTLEELTYQVPNVQISEAAVSTNVFMRGVGSGVNYGFEQSVGTFIDGVYYGRSRSVRNPFLDVERVELLKGPQGVVFGKNTIAGTLNITTRRPSAEPEGSLAVLWEPEYDMTAVTGVVSGPLGDTLSGRLVGRLAEGDGYMDNSLTGNSEPERDEWALRGVLEWAPTDRLTATLKAEAGAYDVVGRAEQLTRAEPTLVALVQAIDPAAEIDFDYDKSGPGTEPLFDQESDDTDTQTYALTLEYQLGEHDLTSITSYTDYDVDASIDADFTNLSLLGYELDQSYEAWSQELRLAGTLSANVDYILGLYYSDESFESGKVVPVNLAAVPALDASLPAVFPRTGTRHQFFTQDTTSWAAFAQATWHVTDRWRLLLGLRYTEDEKEATKRLFFSELGGSSPDPVVSTFFPLLGLGNPHEFDDLDRQEDDLTPSLTVEWDVTDSVMVYGRYSEGFKGGGFDEDNVAGEPDVEEFDSESVVSYSLGFKSMLGGSASLNVELFRSEYDDLQVSTFLGTGGFLVGNAGQAITQGLEADLRWMLGESFSLDASIAWLDAYYDSYENGPCVFGGGTVCDLTDRNLQFSPDYSGNVTLTYETPVSDNWQLTLQGNVNFTDGFDIPGDLDPVVAQDSFYKLGARAALRSTSGRYEVALIGKNLTDEATTSWGNDVPLGNILGNNYFQFIDPPRTISLQGQINF